MKIYLINKPLPAASISEDIISAADGLSEKLTVGRKAKASQEGVYLFYNLRSNPLRTKFV